MSATVGAYGTGSVAVVVNVKESFTTRCIAHRGCTGCDVQGRAGLRAGAATSFRSRRQRLANAASRVGSY